MENSDAGLHERTVQPIEIEAVLRYQKVRSLRQLKADVIGVPEDADDHILRLFKRVNPGDSGAGDFDLVADPESQRLLQLLLNGTFSGLFRQAALHKLRHGNLLWQGLNRDGRFRLHIEKLCSGRPDWFCTLHTRQSTDRSKISLIHQERRCNLDVIEIICIII